MAKWMIKIGEVHVQPIVNILNDECRNSKLLHMDETRIQVLKSHKDPSADHWVWVRRSSPPKKRVVLFDYDSPRGTDVPRRLLEGFEGIFVTDGYRPYDTVAKENGLTHAGCWAHARRYFHEAYKASGKTELLALEAVKRIGKLYHIDKTIKASTSDTLEIYTGRKEKISPLVNEYFEWLETLPHQHLRNNKLGKAIRYSLGQRVKLNEFLNNGEIPLDNNLAENAIRPYVVGRKAWLFCDSQSGAKASTNIYSLVESAKANGKEPHAVSAKLSTWFLNSGRRANT